jgi:threonine synthase
VRYISTRGQAPALEFEEVMLAGLAADGGLYVPESWPTLNSAAIAEFRGLPYAELAARIMQPFVGRCVSPTDLRAITAAAYGRFDHQAVAPLTQLEANLWLMELYHGPTLAFKDVAMQVLGRLYDHVLSRRDQTITLIGATSGDTGSAAIEAVRECRRARIFVMHPHNRTSEVQRRQMTTVIAPNVHNIAIEGTFDDCQGLLKAMFNDADFRRHTRMSAVNSINWARIMPQIVYYFAAALALGAPARPVSFCVPTGNFGDIYAGYCAAMMGLPIERLVIATNVNDILTRALTTGRHELGQVEPTISPSIDIQVSSNFERLLFDIHDRDGSAVAALMCQLDEDGRFEIHPDRLRLARRLFDAHRVDEEQTRRTIAAVYHGTRQLIDPHTAVGIGAAWAQPADHAVPMIVLGTAHPAKFPEAVEQAVGIRPPLPPFLADLYDRPEQFTVLPNDLPTVQQHVLKTLQC